MSAHFIECSKPTFDYHDRRGMQNKPVNLALCKSIEAARFAWYPDNRGRPSIKFNGCDVEWVFCSERERDAEMQRIVATHQEPQS